MIKSAYASTPTHQRLGYGTLNDKSTFSLLVFPHDDAGHDVVLDRPVESDMVGIEDHMHVGVHQPHDGDTIGMDFDGRDRLLEVHITDTIVEHRSTSLSCLTFYMRRQIYKWLGDDRAMLVDLCLSLRDCYPNTAKRGWTRDAAVEAYSAGAAA